MMILSGSLGLAFTVHLTGFGVASSCWPQTRTGKRDSAARRIKTDGPYGLILISRPSGPMHLQVDLASNKPSATPLWFSYFAQKPPATVCLNRSDISFH